MADYIIYILQNRIPLHLLRNLFEERKITIDNQFLNTAQQAYNLFDQIVGIYHNNTREFLRALRKSLISGRKPDFRGFPLVFTQFYSLVSELFDSLSNDRLSVIKRYVNLPIYRSVQKYDYSLEGKLQYQLDINQQSEEIIYMYEEGEEGEEQNREKDSIRSLNILPGNRLVAESYGYMPLRIWNYQTGHFLSMVPDLLKLEFIEDRNLMIGNTINEIRILDPETLQIIRSMNSNGRITSFIVAGDKIVIQMYDFILQIWDVNTFERLKDLNTEQRRNTYLLKYGQNKIITGGTDSIKIWNLDTLTMEQEIDFRVNHSILIDDILISCESKYIQGLNLKTGVIIFKSKLQDDINTIMAIPNDKNHILIRLNYGLLLMWNMRAQKIQFTIKTPSALGDTDTRSITFLPNGDIATTSENGIINVSNQNGTQILSFKAHDGHINALLTLPNGNLVSGGGDGNISIWK